MEKYFYMIHGKALRHCKRHFEIGSNYELFTLSNMDYYRVIFTFFESVGFKIDMKQDSSGKFFGMVIEDGLESVTTELDSRNEVFDTVASFLNKRYNNRF